MTIDHAALERAAREATQGEWRIYQGWVHPDFARPSPNETNGDTAICEPLGRDKAHNAAYIVAAQPAVLLALLEERKKLRAALEEISLPMCRQEYLTASACRAVARAALEGEAMLAAGEIKPEGE